VTLQQLRQQFMHQDSELAERARDKAFALRFNAHAAGAFDRWRESHPQLIIPVGASAIALMIFRAGAWWGHQQRHVR
jgi:hypothetical protein